MSTQILLIAITASVLITTSADCNLLNNENKHYIDTESEEIILTMCSGDVSGLSLWEQYQCEYIQNRDGYQKCWPQRRMSGCIPGELKGVIFLYHGYSACPDQYNAFAPKLQTECWHVYQILTLGHGFNFCSIGSTENTTGCIPSILNATDMSMTYPNQNYTSWYYNESFMPNTRQPYIEYVQKMIKVIEEEVSIIKECELVANSKFEPYHLEVATGGLSFGAPLSAGTVVMSGKHSVFTKYVLMSPFFGITAGPIDGAVYKCTINSESFIDCLPDYFKGTGYDIDDNDASIMTDMISSALTYFVDVQFIDTSYETINLLIRKVLTWVVENSEAISDENIRQQVQNGLNINMPWGKQCEFDILERNRGGFCQFKLRHLVAAHSFANYVIDLLDDIEVDESVQTLLVLVERDGQTRNALAVEYVNKFYNYEKESIYNQSTDCIWLIAQECQKESWTGGIDNYCGVPHSSMSVADNLGINPYQLWWENTYHQGLIAWLNAEKNTNVTFPEYFRVKEKWDLTRNQCSYFDLVNPPKVLIAEIPSLLKIGVRIMYDKITKDIENNILNRMSEVTGVPRGFIELSKSIRKYNSNSNVTRRLSDSENEYDGEVVEFRMCLDKEGAAIFEVLAGNNNIKQIGNYVVDYIELNGDDYNNITNVTCVFSVHGPEESGALVWSEVLLIILLVINVIVVVTLVIWWRKQKNVDHDSEMAKHYTAL